MEVTSFVDGKFTQLRGDAYQAPPFYLGTQLPQSLRHVARCGLKVELQRELNLPRREGAGNPAETGARTIAVRRPEVGFVEQIENFSAELDSRVFSNRQRETLVQSHVELEEGVTARRVAARGAEWAVRRERRN